MIFHNSCNWRCSQLSHVGPHSHVGQKKTFLSWVALWSLTEVPQPQSAILLPEVDLGQHQLQGLPCTRPVLPWDEMSKNGTAIPVPFSEFNTRNPLKFIIETMGWSEFFIISSSYFHHPKLKKVLQITGIGQGRFQSNLSRLMIFCTKFCWFGVPAPLISVVFLLQLPTLNYLIPKEIRRCCSQQILHTE